MKKLLGFGLILVLAAALLTLTGCGSSSNTEDEGLDMENGYTQLDMGQAAELMKNETDYLLLDVRTAEEYAGGHIPGAINVANEAIGDAEVAELPDKDAKILVYCRSGNRSKQAAEKLVKLGYTDIVEIGGINSWEGEIEK